MSVPLRFRKKPIIIEAFQWTAEHQRDRSQWPEWLHRAWEKPNHELGCAYVIRVGDVLSTYITTLEGKHEASENDWIIRGVKGELYPCKPDIFDVTYEAVEP